MLQLINAARFWVFKILKRWPSRNQSQGTISPSILDWKRSDWRQCEKNKELTSITECPEWRNVYYWYGRHDNSKQSLVSKSHAIKHLVCQCTLKGRRERRQNLGCLETEGEVVHNLHGQTGRSIRLLIRTKYFPDSKTLPRIQKHFPESKTRPRIQKHFPESKTLPRIQKHFPELKTLPRIQKHIPESKKISQNSGTCFGFWEVFLDSGKCFVLASNRP